MGWAASATVVMPSCSPLGLVATGLANNAFTMTVAGGATAAAVDVNTTAGSATLVYQVDRTNGILTISPIDITTAAGLSDVHHRACRRRPGQGVRCPSSRCDPARLRAGVLHGADTDAEQLSRAGMIVSRLPRRGVPQGTLRRPLVEACSAMASAHPCSLPPPGNGVGDRIVQSGIGAASPTSLYRRSTSGTNKGGSEGGALRTPNRTSSGRPICSAISSSSPATEILSGEPMFTGPSVHTIEQGGECGPHVRDVQKTADLPPVGAQGFSSRQEVHDHGRHQSIGMLVGPELKKDSSPCRR